MKLSTTGNHTMGVSVGSSANLDLSFYTDIKTHRCSSFAKHTYTHTYTD